MSANAGAMTRRNIWTFLLPVGVCGGCAALLAAALPKIDLPWLALPALAGLFWSWRNRTWKEALGLGFFAGIVYFSLAFSWFGETAGALLGRFGFVTVLGPAILSAPFFALSALAANRAERFAAPAFVPLASALSFGVCEALRAIGPLGNPFAQVAYPQVATPFAALAPWLGPAGVTVAVAFIGASVADFFLAPKDSRRLLVSISTIAFIVIGASIYFPARSLATPNFPVAIIQGNIRQDLKWTQGAFELSVSRYLGLTNTLADTPNSNPAKLIVWPETVIPTDLNIDESLQNQFAHLAARAHATIVAGSLERIHGVPYNTLWYFSPDGTQRVYQKRQLVPFAEWLPAESLLSHLPVTNLISRFGAGRDATVLPASGRNTAPLICWESGFSDLLHKQLQRGADLIIISTDDAWFGVSAGPYQHAQIAQMRAIESGTWVVRAAATGVSGIIAPDGSFTQRSVLNQIQVVQGLVGPRIWTLFALIGPLPVTIAFSALYLATLLTGIVWRRGARSF